MFFLDVSSLPWGLCLQETFLLGLTNNLSTDIWCKQGDRTSTVCAKSFLQKQLGF